MSHDAVQMKHSLVTLLKNTYESALEYSRFHLMIVPKEKKGKHGRYVSKESRIEVFNLSREPIETFLTCVECLSLHVKHIDYGEEIVNETYYHVFHDLLCTAVGLQYLSLEELAECDNEHLTFMIKLFGSLDTWTIPTFKIDETIILVISRGYAIRKVLKLRNYVWFSLAQTWQKEFPTEQALQAELVALKKETDQDVTDDQVSIQRNQNHRIYAYYYLGVSNGYPHRKQLRERGYLWQGYGLKELWVKKIEASHYYLEIRNLGDLAGIEYKKVTPDFSQLEKAEQKKVADLKEKHQTQRDRIIYT